MLNNFSVLFQKLNGHAWEKITGPSERGQHNQSTQQHQNDTKKLIDTTKKSSAALIIENIEIDINSDVQINELFVKQISNQSQLKSEDFLDAEKDQVASISQMSISMAQYPQKSDEISASIMQDSESDNHEIPFSSEEIESSKSSKNTNTFMVAVPPLTPIHVGRQITPIETVEDSVHTFYKSPSPITKWFL